MRKLPVAWGLGLPFSKVVSALEGLRYRDWGNFAGIGWFPASQ